MPTSPYYVNNNPVPSVSTILDYSKDKADLIVWAKRKEKYDLEHGEGAWDQMCDAAKDRGTTLHAMTLETCLLNGVDPRDIYCPEDLKPYWEGNKNNGLKYWLMNLMKKDYEIIACEKPFTHKELYFGGTPDLVIRIDGQNWIWDLKTYKGYSSTYKLPKYKLERIKEINNVEELDTSKTYRWYKSEVRWCPDREAWVDTYHNHQYSRYRRAKKGEKSPKFKDWDWYSDKLSRAFKQCLLYRELLQHDGVPIHNIKVVSASLNTGVEEFVFFDRKLTRSMVQMTQLYNDAHSEVMKQLFEYHKAESNFNIKVAA